jgi:hypothetical protein
MSTSRPGSLGPVARRLICPANWTDQYPRNEAYRKELDVLLAFAEKQNGLRIYKPKLESKNAKRDEYLNELRVAFFLHQRGLPLLRWDPPGLNGRVGEFLVGSPELHNVFVEVKSPGWEGELSNEERAMDRTKQPKYEKAGCFAVGNWEPLRRCISSAYPKFNPSQPNLLVVADDLKFSLHDSLSHVEIALYACQKAYGHSYGQCGYFTSARFKNLGGVGIFEASSAGGAVDYGFHVFPNHFALASAKLPESLLRLEANGNDWQ